MTGIALAMFGAGVVLSLIAGFCTFVYFWWHGVLVGLEHFGIPMLIGFMIMVMMFTRGLGTLILACIGLWASVVLLNMWWFWALCLYATTLAVLFITVVLGAVSALAALCLKTLEEISQRR
jgi:hypothetical protein